MDIKIGGVFVPVAENSEQIEDAIEERSTASFAVVDKLNQFTFQKGQPVEIYDNNLLLFSGIIESALKKVYTHNGVAKHAISCIDWHYLADKRIIANAYTNQHAGEIVRDIVDTILSHEGVQYYDHEEYIAYTQGFFPAQYERLASIDDGPIVHEAVFNYVRVSDALNRLAEKAGYWWKIDQHKRLHFVPRTTYTAPFAVAAADMRDNSIDVEQGNPLYRNRQYVRGGKDITDPQTQSFRGDFENKSFITGFPVAKVPSLELTRAALSFAGTSYCRIPDEVSASLGGKGACTMRMKVFAESASEISTLLTLSVSGTLGKVEFTLTTDRRLRIGGRAVSTDGFASLTTTDAINLNQWYEVEATLDVANNTASIKVDGVQWATPGSISWASSAFSSDVGDRNVIGARVALDRFFQGKIQDVRVYGDDNLIGYWPLNDGEWTDIYDYGPSGLHGEVIGATWTVGPAEAQTVGIRGVEEGRQWYWNKGSNVISQEMGGIPLGAYDTLSVTYQGEFDIVILTESPQEIAGRQSIEGGGTGIVEDVHDERNIFSRTAAFELANAKLDKYGTVGRKVRFQTRRQGLEPGQLLTVTLPEHFITSKELLIDKIEITTENDIVWYTIEAVQGPSHGSWAQLFYHMASRGEAFVVRENISEEQILITLADFNRIWLQTDEPNIFTEVYPGEDTYPGFYPSFEHSDRVKYLAWYKDGVEIGRKAITQQTGADTDEIFTLVFLASFEANEELSHLGWWGGWQATEEIGSGVEVDKQMFDKNKTAVEGIQVNKTDTKGW